MKVTLTLLFCIAAILGVQGNDLSYKFTVVTGPGSSELGQMSIDLISPRRKHHIELGMNQNINPRASYKYGAYVPMTIDKIQYVDFTWISPSSVANRYLNIAELIVVPEYLPNDKMRKKYTKNFVGGIVQTGRVLRFRNGAGNVSPTTLVIILSSMLSLYYVSA